MSTSHGRKTVLTVKTDHFMWYVHVDLVQLALIDLQFYTGGRTINIKEGFFNVYCSTASIKLRIYLSHLYKKVDMDLPHEISLAQGIIHNAKVGLKTLLSFGIKVIPMSQERWTKLAEFARRH